MNERFTVSPPVHVGWEAIPVSAGDGELGWERELEA
jgi:hypothetical protein